MSRRSTSSRRAARPSRSMRRESRKNALWIGLLALSAVLIAGPFAYIAARPTPDVPLDTATLCEDGQPTAYRLAVIDATDPITLGQGARLREEIQRFAASVPRNTMLALGLIDSDASTAPSIVFSMCRPRHGSEANEITENPRLIQERYEASYGDPLEAAIEEIVASFPGLEIEGQDAAGQDGISVSRTSGETILTFADAITFDAGSAVLTEATRSDLADVGTRLEAEGISARIVGHADATGQAEANLALSTDRALAVASALRAGGLDASRLTSVGRGSDQPITSNDTEAGRAANRRVEIILARRSPILEDIQAIVSATPTLAIRGPETPVEFLLVSDLLQNTGTVNFYRGDTWSDFVESAHFDRLSRNLGGFEVSILRFPRPDSRIEDPRIVEDFWSRYFDHQHVRALSSIRVLGDL